MEKDALQEAGFRRILPEGKYTQLTVCYVPPTTRPGSKARATPSSSFSPKRSAETTQPERLDKRARRTMEEEGLGRSGKVLSEHPLEYKEDEEESEGEAYLFDSEEERMAEWVSQYSCYHCGRLVPNTQSEYWAFCSKECSDRDWDKLNQDRCAEAQWYQDHCVNAPVNEWWLEDILA
jgi:endogenous inhibitor of DNA gyrase (YacG/DUF329 family)